MKGGLEEARFRAVGLLGRRVVATLFATCRWSRSGEEHIRSVRGPEQGILFAFWHDQLLPLAHAHRDEDIVVLVSEHRDGEYIARIIQRHGYRTARGSSTRGGARGLRTLVRFARDGHDLGITPDGPRGPRHRFKEGALLAAQLTGFPVLPLAAAASSAWRFDSWDRFMVPRPLSRIHVAYGPTLRIPRDADGEFRRKSARALEETLEELTRIAEAQVGAPGARREGGEVKEDIGAPAP